MSLVCCALAFVAAFVLGQRSLVHGVGVVLAVGYAFGIARANLLDTVSYFIFDAAVFGLYVAAIALLQRPEVVRRIGGLRVWLGLLIGWPLLMLAVPLQDFMVQLVGFRGNVYLVPLMAVGALLDQRRIAQLAVWLAVLNLGAFALAAVQYQIGIEPFFPPSPVTDLMYRSKDVVGNSAYRIPSSFSNAHSYGGTMARSLPWLLAAWVRPGQSLWTRGFFATAIAATVLGVLVSSTRVSAVIMFAVLLVFSLSPEVGGWFRLIWVGLFGLLGYVVSNEQRLQRFTQLTDVDMVAGRVEGSVNASFFELLKDYPMGNGLGGGGTSLPAFLAGRLRNPVGMENEFSRIMLEQGTVGLLIWLAFIGWAAARSVVKGEWTRSVTARMFAAALVCDLTLALIGTGMLTSIPSTVLIMLHFGYLARDIPAPRPVARPPLQVREPS